MKIAFPGPALALAALLGVAGLAGAQDADTTRVPTVGEGAAPDTSVTDSTTTAAVDTTLRVTGTPFRFGSTFERVAVHGEYKLARVAGRRGEVARVGTGRWLGINGELTLFFVRGHLRRVAFKAIDPSPHAIDYAQDQLRASGFRRQCEPKNPRSCTWDARTRIKLDVSPVSLEASIEPAPPAALRRPRAETVMVRELFVIGRSSASSTLPAPKVASSPAPEYPASAATDRVQGNVWVRALVDEKGGVLSATISRSIPELDAAAVQNAMRWRFEPYRLDGVPARFEVEFPVRFILR